MSISVAIIEDDQSVRTHLESIIRASNLCVLSGSAGHRAEAMALIDKNTTDVYLVDLGLPDVDGVDIIAYIKEHCAHAQSMVLSTFGDAKHVGRSIRAGAKGYLLKDEASHTLIEKIVALHNGASPISAPIAKILFQQLSESQNEPAAQQARTEAIARFQLGAREVDVIGELALGLSIVHIADRLNISPHTVNQHLRNIYRKLNVRSRSLAVFVAKENGIV